MPTEDSAPRAPTPPPWPELARLRWGPGKTDKVPGIVHDDPAPAGRAERLARIYRDAATDPYAVEERAAIREADGLSPET